MTLIAAWRQNVDRPHGTFNPFCNQQNGSTLPILPLSGPSSSVSRVLIVKNLWNIADLIDLHYFFQLDEELRLKEGEGALAKRDRIIYLAKIGPQLGKADDIPPRLLVRKWLAIRRLQFLQEKGHEGLVLPGTVWRELTAICRGLFLFAGLLVGIGLAGSFLLYSGTAPLNVSSYLGGFVLLQLLFVGLQAFFFLYRMLRRIPMESTGLYVLIGRLLMKGMERVRRGLQRKLSGRQRLDLAALIGGVQQHKELAVLLIWPAFILVQLGGIGFNLGVIGATLARVIFSDIAFGWQSSLQLSAGAVARLVQWIALPWSWAMPQAYPSLEQIQGSQMVLKEGIAHLTTGALVSWWPFLCFAVAVYGLLPRLALLVLGLVQQQRALERLHFATLGVRPLLQRMTAPRVDTNAVTTIVQGAFPVYRPDRGADSAPATAPERMTPVPEGALWFVLIPDEIYDECPLSVLSSLLLPRIGFARIEGIRSGGPGVALTEIPVPLTQAAGAAGLAGVLLLQEAWQPPLRETESFVRQLRQVVGETIPLTILLIGKPSAESIFTPVDHGQLQIWSQKMRTMGDPGLEVQPLVQQ